MKWIQTADLSRPAPIANISEGLLCPFNLQLPPPFNLSTLGMATHNLTIDDLSSEARERVRRTIMERVLLRDSIGPTVVEEIFAAEFESSCQEDEVSEEARESIAEDVDMENKEEPSEGEVAESEVVDDGQAMDTGDNSTPVTNNNVPVMMTAAPVTTTNLYYPDRATIMQYVDENIPPRDVDADDQVYWYQTDVNLDWFIENGSVPQSLHTADDTDGGVSESLPANPRELGVTRGEDLGG
ncbi:hypothetical protein NEOLEDRAFT_1244539 [Neolentinus lepideus HHB14362 ss-1]|uniref:Uncharacterized protein n=1 Tax=Neolentinus lepideus HHB14362 ss-1 TaxID=1314782 RepID=A0A165PSU6_9AGAM|nr:hypothetical protein NEOLEDRAFT_1244539 [Neolentinus lepideus HHB14362 ss-1]